MFRTISRTARIGERLASLRNNALVSMAIVLCIGLAAAPIAASAAAFTPGNLVVYRIGDGSAALTSAAQPVFLDEYTPTGTLVQSIAMPTAASGVSGALTANGTSTSEGYMTRSADGNCLILPGYDAAPGTAAVSGTTAAANNRIIARVDWTGNVDTTTRLTGAFSTANIRSATSSNCNDLWAVGSASGVAYALPGTTSAGTIVSTTGTNLRTVTVANGQLYISTASGALRVASVGSGLPTTSGQVATNLPGFPTTGGSPYQVFFADLDTAVAGPDTIYFSDDSGASTGGVYKYSFNGTTWTSRGFVALGSARGLTGVVNGTSVTLYATDGATLRTFTDTGGPGATINGTLSQLATAGTNRVFRGVALTPGVPPAVDLSVGVAGPTSAFAATNYNYVVTVTNGGTSLVNAVDVRFTLPAGVTFQSGTSSTGGMVTVTSGVASTTFASVAAGSTATMTISVQAASPGIVNVGPGSAQVDPSNTVVEGNEANNSSTQSIATTVVSSSPIAINVVQGSASASMFTGALVSVEGIVTANYQGTNQLSGFFVQTPDAEQDVDPTTSEGIFVFTGAAPAGVALGDRVRVSGTVVEFGVAPNTSTQISNPAVVVLSSGNALPTAVTVSLPTATAGELERYEGMRVVFTQTLTVSSTDNLMRFGEVVLSGTGRLIQPTNIVDPNDNPASGTNSVTDPPGMNSNSNIAAVSALQALNNRSTVILDDASTAQYPNPIPFWDTVQNTLRLGTTVQNLTGVLSQAFGTHRVYATTPPAFNYGQRPVAPPNVGGNIKVGSMNVLNYFNGPTFPTSRGATTAAELARQRAKMIAAITGLNADVIGLMEVENDGEGATSAIQDIVNGLNTAQGAGTWAFISTPAFNISGATGVGLNDQIKPAIIYKAAVLAPVGAAQIASSATFFNARAPLAQVFRLIANDEQFALVVNHFKSKGGTGTGLDADQGDGQADFNDRRKQQATALVSFIGTLGTTRVLTVGDYNAYGEEDPIDILRAAGLTSLINGSYSYVFEGQVGALDHAFATAGLATLVTGADEWHINADEPTNLDYNLENKSPLNCTVSCLSPDYFDALNPLPFAASDHDPLLVGLSLKAGQTITFGALADKLDNATPFTVSATTSANLTVAFVSQTSTVCTTSGTNGTTVTILAIGTCTIRASQAGDANFNAAVFVDRSFTVTSSAVACSPGSFSATGFTPCTPASAGSFVATPGAMSQTACEPGTFTDLPGQSACTPAPAGTYAAGLGNTAATPCTAGRYSASVGATNETTCLLASAGNFVANPGSPSQTPCPEGRFNPSEGQLVCQLAPAGSFASGTGNTTATQCPAGRFSGAPGAAACTPAPAGSYAAGLGNTAATPCTAGRYSASVGAISETTCLPASAGNFVANPGSAVQTPCFAGTFTPLPAQIVCEQAPAGSFASGTGNTTATQCTAGTFSGAPGAAACTLAPAGSFVSLAGASAATLCTAGTFQDQQGQLSCRVAPIGRFVPFEGAIAATICPAESTTLVTAATTCLSTPRDLNGDRQTDVVARFVGNGAITAFEMIDGVAMNSRMLTDGTWSFVASGDFNGDGKSDLLIRNTDGSLYVVLMDGSTNIIGGGYVTSGNTWSLAKVLDLDTDGKSDIVLRHTDGSLYMLLMNGAIVSSGAYLTTGDVWALAGAADFNGDGKADILLRSTDGSLYITLMDGLTVASGAYLTSGNTWQLAQTLDLNGDGKSDVVLRATDGSLYLLLMNGTSIASGAYLTSGSDWDFAASADFDGNGKQDIVLRYAPSGAFQGSLYILLMDGTMVTNGAYLTSGSIWTLTTTGFYNQDRKADVILESADGRSLLLLMDATTVASFRLNFLLGMSGVVKVQP
jgi:predicted extracellular nuclease